MSSLQVALQQDRALQTMLRGHGGDYYLLQTWENRDADKLYDLP